MLQVQVFTKSQIWYIANLIFHITLLVQYNNGSGQFPNYSGTTIRLVMPILLQNLLEISSLPEKLLPIFSIENQYRIEEKEDCINNRAG